MAHKIIIDVYNDEARGDKIYHIKDYAAPAESLRLSDACCTSGLFTDLDDLNQWLEDHADNIEIVMDLR